MEAAVEYTFSEDVPAPPLSTVPGDAQACLECTVSMDSVRATKLLCDAGMKPAVLNFAHGYNCGGGFEHASGSQEEDIFRKTSVFLSLWPHRREDDGPGVLKRGTWIGDFDDALPRQKAFYPHAPCGGVFSPNVRFVSRIGEPPARNKEDTRPIELSASSFGVITVAAQDCGREPPFRPSLLRQKIRTVLYIAARNSCDSVVFGLFGCGYFRNPPAEVATAFKELLQGEFAGIFRAALCAVPFGGREFEAHFPPVTPEKVAKLLGVRESL
uniref:Microbial-type PARG catalytic domain-containing protein n=1 Tax=Noctiluca scintillans TaxID=2966 RepID=A0A7S1ADC5_NOCSC